MLLIHIHIRIKIKIKYSLLGENTYIFRLFIVKIIYLDRLELFITNNLVTVN
jgi:hypothetical protein